MLDRRRAEMNDVTSQVSKEIRSKFAENMSEVRLEPYLRIGFRTGNLEITVLFLDLLFFLSNSG